MPACPPILPKPTPRRMPSARGVTLVELMIGLAVLAFLLMSGAPAFSDWILNTRVRSASESILNGIQYARTEAARRNAVVRFQLTDSLEASCALSTSGRHWVITQNRDENPEGECQQDISDAASPFILQKASAAPSSAVVIASDRASVAFNSLGEQVDVDGEAARTLTRIDITSSQGACVRADGNGGNVRCLRVELHRSGQARLCDPGLPDTEANRPMRCLAP